MNCKEHNIFFLYPCDIYKDDINCKHSCRYVPSLWRCAGDWAPHRNYKEINVLNLLGPDPGFISDVLEYIKLSAIRFLPAYVIIYKVIFFERKYVYVYVCMSISWLKLHSPKYWMGSRERGAAFFLTLAILILNERLWKFQFKTKCKMSRLYLFYSHKLYKISISHSGL